MERVERQGKVSATGDTQWEDELMQKFCSKRSRMKFTGWTVSGLAMAAMLATPALAQTAQPNADADEDDVIIVSGIRRGIADSISIKEDETSIVEAISAEDIGKLPDVSIAESLARLPGLAGQRVNGRAQVISIRGLSPDFTTTLLNGRQQASSGDNRAVEFDQYPSELLSSVVVYKTPDASIAGFGLSGTADLRTVRPLDVDERVLAVSLRGEMIGTKQLNDEISRKGWRGTISYVDKFFDDTLGVAIGFAHMDSPSQNRHFKIYGFESFGFATTPDSADSALQVNGQEAFAYSRRNKRDAAIGILEWQPSSTVHTTLDLYYSRFKQTEVMRGAQWFSNGWADNATFTNVETTDFGGTALGTSGTFNNAAPILRNDYNTRDDRLIAIGLNNEFQISDRLQWEVDLSYSRNKRDESITETYAGYGAGPQGTRNTTDSYEFNFNPGNDFPDYSGFNLNYADASQVSLGDRAPWGGWGHDGLKKSPHVRESIYAIDTSLQYDIDGFFDSVEVGANFTKRTKTKTVDELDLDLRNSRAQTLVSSDYLVNPTSLGFVGFGDVLAVDLSRALDVYYVATPLANVDHYDKAWGIDEEVLTGKAKLSFNSGPLRGNLGLQVVHQRQESNGLRINPTQTPIELTNIRAGRDYTDILPSLNVIYDLGGGHRLRFAAAKVMARPRMDDMRANLIPGFNGTVCAGSGGCAPGSTVNPWSATGGNPNLEPWRAKAVDLAYEWYIGPASYISIAGFYKKLDTYIFTRSEVFDFSGLPLPTIASSIPSNVTISPLGTISYQDNGKGGNLKGLEFSGAMELGRVVPFLDGFGVQGSLSLTWSNLNMADPATNGVVVKRRIPGLSKTVYNLTAYYEKYGFQARVSYRYRSGYKGEVVQLFATRGFTEVMADKQVDAQIGYSFAEGSSLDGLSVLLQVTNLTDSPYRTRLGLDDGGTKASDGSFLPETFEKYGRQFLFGISYKF